MYCLYNYLYFNKVYNYNITKIISLNIKKFNKYDFNFYSNNIFLNKNITNTNILINNNYKVLFNYKNKYIYSFDKNNNSLLKRIFSVLSNLFLNGFNITFLDLSYKMVLPLYNYIFGFKNLYYNKDFFFIDKKSLTRKNWSYLYINTLKRFNVGLLIVSDLYFLKNFITILKTFNLPIFSLIPSNMRNVYVDYYLFVNLSNINLYKFFLYNFTSNIYFKYNKLYLNKLKYFYLKSFNLFLKI